MFTSVEFISVVMLLICLPVSAKVKTRLGPTGMSFNDTTTCVEFSKYGRFNPYSVLFEKWFVFYYWDKPSSLETYIFTFPTANHTRHLHRLLDGYVVLPVDWSARHILMEDHRKAMSLLVERGDRGEYWSYPLIRLSNGRKITPRDIRLKQTGDNKLLGYMDCQQQTLRVMARINHVPPQNRLLEEASRLGFRGRRGKSYLYQGHEWGPIPEADEKRFWYYEKKRNAEKTPKENTEESGKESKTQSSSSTKDEENTKQIPNKEENIDTSRVHEPSSEELNERCIKIEPELWNDPKPKPTYDPENPPITKQELEGPGPIIEVTDNSLTHDQYENNIVKKPEIVINKDTTILDTTYSTNRPDSSFSHHEHENNETKESDIVLRTDPSTFNATALDKMNSTNTLNSSLTKKLENNLTKNSEIISATEPKLLNSTELKTNSTTETSLSNNKAKNGTIESEISPKQEPSNINVIDTKYSTPLSSSLNNKFDDLSQDSRNKPNEGEHSPDSEAAVSTNITDPSLSRNVPNESESKPNDSPSSIQPDVGIHTPLYDDGSKHAARKSNNEDDDDDKCYVCYKSEPVKYGEQLDLKNIAYDKGSGNTKDNN